MTLVASGAISLSLVPSRTTGVAPLAVFFDATGTASPVTAQPFHEIEYRWDFGDSAGGATWSNGSRAGNSSKNSARGPVAAHVFETPGTYTVTLTAFDGTNTVTTTIAITVGDPNVVFAGTNTICVAAASVPVAGSGGCPASAAVAQQSNFATIVNTYLAANKRVLLKRGDTFTGSTSANINMTGPWTLGAYGSGNAPKIQNSGSNLNVIALGAGAGAFPKDGRIMDLEINGLGSTAPSSLHAIRGVGNFDQLTLLRLNINNIGDGFELYAGRLNVRGNSRVWDQIALVDSTIQGITGGRGRHGVYVFATRLSLLGNLIDDCLATEHLLRVEYADRAVFSNNTLSNSNFDKEQFGLRGVGQTAASYYFQHVLPAPSPTQYVVVSDNRFLNNAYVAFQAGPVNDATATVIRDVISERNWYLAPAPVAADSMIWSQALRHTIRNELIDMTNMRYYQPIYLIRASSGMAAASNINIYNNTLYSSANSANGGVILVLLQSGVTTGITIKNNLAYFPALTGTTNISSGGTTTRSNNSTDSSGTNQIRLTSPNFTVTPPSSPAHYKPTTGSYAIGGGATSPKVPVWSDFFGVNTPATPDIGAVVH